MSVLTSRVFKQKGFDVELTDGRQRVNDGIFIIQLHCFDKYFKPQICYLLRGEIVFFSFLYIKQDYKILN